MFHIQDWTGKICFYGKTFDSFDDAEEFLVMGLEDCYETDRQEYYIEEVQNVSN